MKSWIAAIAVGSMLAITPVESAAAREHKDIIKPYYDRWGKWQKVRKEMRKRLKNGETFTGDDWFTLASVCAIQPPPSGSMIRDRLNRSPCRKNTVEYFVKAAETGTPRGYLEASLWTGLLGGTPAQAWPYAALAYRFSARDGDLSADALKQLRKLGHTPSEFEMQQVNRTAMQLVARGVYPGDGPSGDRRLADLAAPQLDWLDFKNPKRCQYGDGWKKVMGGSWRDRSYRAVSSTVALPNTGERVTGRIVRPYREEPSIVRVEADFEGQWNGLKVLGIFDTFIEGSHSVWGDGIRFAEPIDVVARRLATLGFVVNLDGSERKQVDDMVRYNYKDAQGRPQVSEHMDGVITRLERINGQTYFFCDEIFETIYAG